MADNLNRVDGNKRIVDDSAGLGAKGRSGREQLLVFDHVAHVAHVDPFLEEGDDRAKHLNRGESQKD